MRCKNVTNNSQNSDYRCFQYAFTIAQHYEEIISSHQRVSNIKLFIEIFNLDGINCPTPANEYNKSAEIINWDIALFMLYVDVDVNSFKDNDGEYANRIN